MENEILLIGKVELLINEKATVFTNRKNVAFC